MRNYAVSLSIPAIFQGPRQYRYGKDDAVVSHWSLRFRVFKFLFDKSFAVLGLSLTGAVALVLLVLNPFFNPGPLFFCQERLGRRRMPFLIWKFRTMTPDISDRKRTARSRLELDRITPLGRALRKYRIDELPNFFNVLRGDMSVIGPRPDCARLAKEYLATIDHYDYRYKVKPGITGLAQIESGYAEGVEATSCKAHYDQIYVETSSGRLDVYIAYRTCQVILTGFGAR